MQIFTNCLGGWREAGMPPRQAQGIKTAKASLAAPFTLPIRWRMFTAFTNLTFINEFWYISENSRQNDGFWNTLNVSEAWLFGFRFKFGDAGWEGGGLQAIRQRKALTFISDTQSPTAAWNNKIFIVEQVDVTFQMHIFQGSSNVVFRWSSVISSAKFKVYKWVDFMQKIMRFLPPATRHSSRGWVGRWIPQR